MSTSMAVAAVTHTLKRLINNKIGSSVISGVVDKVTAYSPDIAQKKSNDQENYINVYLYMVRENQGWKNHDLASRNNSGDRITNPYLSLDLFYVLSAHGKDELHGDMMLGYSMLEFHYNAILGRDFIAAQIATQSIIKSSDLSNQIEQIKITPESLNTEEISRLWTMFGTKHRQSAYYKVSVVMMRKDKPVSEALPVKERKIYAKPFKQPTITDLNAEERGDPNYKSTKILIKGDDLIIKGFSLKGEITFVSFNGAAGINVTVIDDSKLKVSLPIALTAGVHSIQVLHKMLLGEPLIPHNGVNSNLAAFVLSPTLTNPSFSAGKLKVKVNPSIPSKTKYIVLLNEIGFDTTAREANAYAIKGKTANVVANLTVDLASVTAGSYLVRIRVNNATSPLFGDYSGPKIVKP